jgi:hypothetical protein
VTRREIVELCELFIAELAVEFGGLPGLRPQIDPGQAKTACFLLGLREHGFADTGAAERLFDPDELGIQPVEENLADQSAGGPRRFKKVPIPIALPQLHQCCADPAQVFG